MRVAFFGLGAMGAPMAARLAAAGFAVVPFDPDEQARARWMRKHPAAHFELAEAAVVVTCVTNERALEALAVGTLLPALPAGALCIDHTTTSATLARRLASLFEERGAAFADAPVSGGPEGAAQGALVAMVGGREASVAKARRYLSTYASRIVHLGGPGSGQTAKMANQIAIAGTVRGLAEAIALARGGGLDVAALLDALAAGTAASVQLARTRAAWTDGTVEFADAFEWLGKDLALAAEDAASRGVTLPLV